MPARLLLCLLSLVLLMLPACSTKRSTGPALIPLPQKMVLCEGEFPLFRETRIEYDEPSADLSLMADLIRTRILSSAPAMPDTGSASIIRLKLTDQGLEHHEAYRLTVSTDRVLIEGRSTAGLFYGIQTLVQLLPPPKADGADQPVLPAVRIFDSPRFDWRGLHLDCCRHFMPVGFIKRYLDHMARYKLNVFHWHLTEDQGWRVEIKAFPRLTQVGSQRRETRIGHASERPSRFDGRPHGGFYTQDEIREIVAYAAERFITIVPELEMPGHAQAAIAAYPELGCTGEAVEVWTDWGVSPTIFNVEEETFAFLEKVIDEMVDLFPGPWFHVGGDEAVKDQWQTSSRIQQRMKELGIKSEEELQSYFITRMEQYLSGKGKTLIGWDEILEGGLAPNAVVMSWRGTKGGIDAARAGHKVIMSPGSHCYFDHYAADPESEPLAIGGYTPLIKVYQFDPVLAELTPEEGRFILGGQANLWTEYIPTPEHAEFMLFPRITALAECLWTEPQRKDWPDFKTRVKAHQIRFDCEGIRYNPRSLDAPLENPSRY